MQQALTILISAQAGAVIAFAAFALLSVGGGHGDEDAAAPQRSKIE